MPQRGKGFVKKYNSKREGFEKLLPQRDNSLCPRGEGIGKEYNSEWEGFEKCCLRVSTTCAPEGKGLVEDSVLSRINNFRPEGKDK